MIRIAPSLSAPEGVKKSISALLDKCFPWLRGTLGGSFLETYDHPLAPSNQRGEPKLNSFTPSLSVGVRGKGGCAKLVADVTRLSAFGILEVSIEVTPELSLNFKFLGSHEGCRFTNSAYAKRPEQVQGTKPSIS